MTTVNTEALALIINQFKLPMLSLFITVGRNDIAVLCRGDIIWHVYGMKTVTVCMEVLLWWSRLYIKFVPLS